ncbi:MAG: Rpn family recombination-promoting nuclease/putative transposase [Selenomonadaceae bacterium]|nr:Rpn family recombination-promoting nuclease/putative transposase [Selenomonadaceae bacterium]
MDENKKTTETNSGTPFDDVFRTMVNDCKRLLLPVLNEMFHYSYEGDEEIEFLPTERYLHNLDDKSERRGSDSAFKVTGKDGYERNYIIECQSKPDNSMAVRILEYGIKFAIDNADKEKNKISIHIPNTGVFQLRSTKNTPDNIQVEIVAPQNNKLSYSVPVLKMRNYSLEEIFTKNLSFMLPFYMFNNYSTTIEQKMIRILPYCHI